MVELTNVHIFILVDIKKRKMLKVINSKKFYIKKLVSSQIIYNPTLSTQSSQTCNFVDRRAHNQFHYRKVQKDEAVIYRKVLTNNPIAFTNCATLNILHIIGNEKCDLQV